MRKIHNTFILLTVSVLFICCNSTTERQRITLPEKLLSLKLLNSERIKEKFGSYGIKVLSHTSDVRVSNLYSLKENDTITRTFAVVNYPKHIDSSYADIHIKIINGSSIGKVFKENGWSIDKAPLLKGKIDVDLSKFSYVYDLMSIQKETLAFYMYNFYIKKDGKNYKYATITEVYHPQYINAETLNLLYKDVNIPTERTSGVNQNLTIVYRKMQQE